MATKRNRAYWKKRTLLNEAYAQNMGKKLIKEYEKAYLRAYDEIVKEINRLAAKAKVSSDELGRTELWDYGRILKFKEIIEEEFGAITNDMVLDAEQTLSDIYVRTLGVNAKAFGREFAVPNDFQVKAIVNEVYHGSNYSKRIWKNNNAIAARIESDLTRMITLGKSPTEIKREIQKDFNTAYSNADRLVRTESSRVFANANMTSYKEYGLEKVEHLAENDSCPHCKALQGEIFDVATAPHVVKHPNCRCTYAPYFED